MNQRDDTNTIRLIYILYILDAAVPFAALIGLIFAYMHREGATPAARSHYDYQIQTFWLTIAWLVVGLVLLLIFVGWIVLVLLYFWFLFRAATGLRNALRDPMLPAPNAQHPL